MAQNCAGIFLRWILSIWLQTWKKKRNITFPVRSYTQGANHPFLGIPAFAITSKVVHQK